jgi:flagellar motility protein MotE (MotC chaperone)
MPGEGIETLYLAGAGPDLAPWILAEAYLHFARAKAGVDRWETRVLVVTPGDGPQPSFDEAEVHAPGALALTEAAPAGARYAPLPSMLARPKSKARLEKQIATHLYRSQRVVTFSCPKLRLRAEPGESKEAFAGRVAHLARERRDAERAKVQARFEKRFARLRARIDKAEERLDREEDQLRYAESNRTIAVGTSVLGSLFGRRLFSGATARRAGMAMRAQSRVAREREDVDRAKENLEALQQELSALDAEMREALEALAERHAAEPLPEIREVAIPPRKSDTEIVRLALLWR